MNKTSKVTLWIEPASHQILKYTFDDLGWDFFPGSWLVRVSDVTASMTVGQAVPGRLAAARSRDGHRLDAGRRAGGFALHARLPRLSARGRHLEDRHSRRALTCSPHSSSPSRCWPARQQPERIADIQVHGNTLTSDAEILQLAGIQLGMTVDADDCRRCGGPAAGDAQVRARRGPQALRIDRRSLAGRDRHRRGRRAGDDPRRWARGCRL